MKLTVLGAGAIGSAIALDLLAQPGVEGVQVVDARAGALRALRDADPRLRVYQVDARDDRSLRPIIRGSTAVVSCVTPELNPRLAELALDAGAHFCSLGGSGEFVQQELALAERAEELSRWVVPNCGLAPGLVNILAMHGIAQFDRAEAVHIRVGDLPIHPTPPFNHQLAHSAEKLIDDYTCPATIIEGGEVREVEPLTGLEPVRFEAPFGALEAFYAGGGVSTLPYDLAGRVQTLDYKLIRYPGHAEGMRFTLALGLGSKKSIDVRTHLSYRDVLVRQLKHQLGGAYQDAVLVRVRVEGEKDGQPASLTYEMIERFDEETGRSAMQRCTGYSAAVATLLVASGAVPGGGAAPPERILPAEAFLDGIKERGLRVRTRWHRGESARPRATPAA